MRIVYSVLDGRLAGGQVICRQIMLAARLAGHEVCLITPSRGEFTELLELDRIPVNIIPMTRSFHLQRALQFGGFLKQWQTDLVHTHAAVPGTILARIGARVANVPVISHIHIANKFSERTWIKNLQVRLDNLTARLGAAIVTVSEDTRQSLIQQGIPSRFLRVIHNGISIENFDNDWQFLRGELGTGNGPVVGTVARLCPVKGQREFIKAAQQVVARHPQTRFVIVGADFELDGLFRDELEALTMNLGLSECVHFMGFRSDAARLISSFDVFVLPSWTEGLPVTILEAMAAARPVVATDVGGVSELVLDGETGLLIPPRDPSSLSEAIVWMLENSEDAREFGKNGHERVKSRFSTDKMLQEIFQLYDSVGQVTAHA